MDKGLEVNVEMGFCTKDMAKENPIKDFEMLIEEYKDKWSTQMYDYFKECLNEIKKKEKALEIIKSDPTFVMYVLNYHYTHWDNKEEYDSLKEVLS